MRGWPCYRRARVRPWSNSVHEILLAVYTIQKKHLRLRFEVVALRIEQCRNLLLCQLAVAVLV